MGHGKVSMSGVELFKYRFIMDYFEGRLSRLEVATKLKVSERTISRYSAKVGVSVIVRHKNSNETIPHKILELHKIRECKHTKENDLARHEDEAAQ